MDRSEDDPASARVGQVSRGYGPAMKLLRSAAAIGIAKKVYDEARKPENQRRMKDAAASLRARQQARKRRGG
jgi:hypothetical protein